MVIRDAPQVDVRRADERYRTQTAGRDTRHCFSSGRHYDGANTSHGVLLVHDDHVVAAGAGFDPHRHRDMEVVTWVVQGSLVHADSAGHRGVVVPGLVQRMSAGTGVLHSERNDAHRLDAERADEPVRFVQMWVVPDQPGGPPGYEQLALDDRELDSGLVPVASGLARHAGAAAVGLGSSRAALHAARLRPGQDVTLPEAPFVHLFVVHGAVVLEGAGPLGAGDAVRLTAAAGQRVRALESCEVLVWEMHADLTA